MYSVRSFALVILLAITGCGSIVDDLRPSGADNRGTVSTGVTGSRVGQNAADFSVSDTLGNTITLYAELLSYKGVVLYFTMWCPVCDAHMDHLSNNAMKNNPDVKFYFVDYVSGSVSTSRESQVSSGYGASRFTVLADIDNDILNSFDATMGTTVVIDNTGIIRMNEDYKEGTELATTLGALQ